VESLKLRSARHCKNEHNRHPNQATTRIPRPHRHCRTNKRPSLPRKTRRRYRPLVPYLSPSSLRNVFRPLFFRVVIVVAEDNCNVQLRDVTMTARDGRVSHLEHVYIRGSHVRFFVIPDMLRNAPMFRNKAMRARGAVRGGRGGVRGR